MTERQTAENLGVEAGGWTGKTSFGTERQQAADWAHSDFTNSNIFNTVHYHARPGFCSAVLKHEVHFLKQSESNVQISEHTDMEIPSSMWNLSLHVTDTISAKT
jgi:hypothetical protein